MTVYECRVPYLSSELNGQTSRVEILNQAGVFTESLVDGTQSTVMFRPRPAVRQVTP